MCVCVCVVGEGVWGCSRETRISDIQTYDISERRSWTDRVSSLFLTNFALGKFFKSSLQWEGIWSNTPSAGDFSGVEWNPGLPRGSVPAHKLWKQRDNTSDTLKTIKRPAKATVHVGMLAQGATRPATPTGHKPRSGDV